MWHNHLWTGALSRKMRVSIPQIVAYLVYFLFLSLYDFTRKNKKDTNNDSQSFVLCLFICWDMCYIAIFFFISLAPVISLIYIYIYIYICSSQLMLTSIFNGAGCTTMVHPNHYSHTQMKDANSSCPIPIFFIKKKLPPNDRTNIHINNNKL